MWLTGSKITFLEGLISGVQVYKSAQKLFAQSSNSKDASFIQMKH